MRILVQSIRCVALATVLAVSGLYAQDEGGEAGDARDTTHGVFTDEQATRGEDVFWNICSECHFEDDFGAAFIESWSGVSVKDLLDEIVATMPEDNPGGMPMTQYIDVVTYMFKLNGLPAGDAELGEDQLDAVQIKWEPSK